MRPPETPLAGVESDALLAQILARSQVGWHIWDRLNLEPKPEEDKVNWQKEGF